MTFRENSIPWLKCKIYTYFPRLHSSWIFKHIWLSQVMLFDKCFRHNFLMLMIKLSLKWIVADMMTCKLTMKSWFCIYLVKNRQKCSGLKSQLEKMTAGELLRLQSMWPFEFTERRNHTKHNMRQIDFNRRIIHCRFAAFSLLWI